jgi:hypothetical protein
VLSGVGGSGKRAPIARAVSNRATQVSQDPEAGAENPYHYGYASIGLMTDAGPATA